jgi:hypothetical protein
LGSFWQNRTVPEANRLAPIKLGSFWQKRKSTQRPAVVAHIELGSFWQKRTLPR